MLTDPISDMLARIRNAIHAHHEAVAIPSSKIKVRICEVLKAQGYINNFKVVEDGRQGKLYVALKYALDRSNAITGIKRVSKPGRRVYVQRAELPRVLNGLGIAILSTSQGVLTDNDARKLSVGGEYLCSVW